LTLNPPPSENSRGNESILTLNPPPSDRQAGESLVVDANVIGFERDSRQDIEALEVKFTASLNRCRCILWTSLLLVILAFVLGISLFITNQSSDANSASALCSIDNILQECYESTVYRAEIPACVVDRYQTLRQVFMEELNVTLPNKKACSSENLALLSVAKSTSNILYNTNLTQRYGLTLLYFATSGRMWKNRRDWLSDISYCQWGSNQIVCSPKGYVMKIMLDGNNLQGSLPQNLMTFLSRLTYLAAKANSLIGAIPSDLSQLSALWLDNNVLTGAIPRSFVESESMKTLSLSQNNKIVLDRY
jgi:hypothetical protein